MKLNHRQFWRYHSFVLFFILTYLFCYLWASYVGQWDDHHISPLWHRWDQVLSPIDWLPINKTQHMKFSHLISLVLKKLKINRLVRDSLTCAPMLVIAAGSTVSLVWGGSLSSLHRSMHQSFPKTPSMAGGGSCGSGRRSRPETDGSHNKNIHQESSSKKQLNLFHNLFQLVLPRGSLTIKPNLDTACSH